MGQRNTPPSPHPADLSERHATGGGGSLGEIANTLEQRKGEPRSQADKLPNKPSQLVGIEKKVYDAIKAVPHLSAEAMGVRLNLTKRECAAGHRGVMEPAE